MSALARVLVVTIGLLLFSSAKALNHQIPKSPGQPIQSDPPKACTQCAAWNARHAPFKIFGNTYYVGVKGLSSVLVTSDNGLILLDGGLPQSAPLIDAGIRELGFKTADIRLIVTSHTHFDHVGGVSALQRATGATVAASPEATRALERGLPVPEDPQAGAAGAFPAVASVRAITDGEVLRVGALAIAAHFTPGHTPGGTTWSWRSCEGQRCVDVVYADSLTPVSNDGFKYTQRPELIDRFRRSIATVARLPCDILISVHPEFVDIAGKLARRDAGVQNPFIDPGACRVYATGATRMLNTRVAAEQKGP